MLTAWLESVQQERRDVGLAWVSLDEGDNDLSRLLTHLAVALNGPGLELGTSWSQEAAGGGTTAMTALVNEFATASETTPDRHWVVILDDFHVINAAAVHDSVTFLLDNLPRRVHLVIATRSDPPLPLARLRSRGQLVELRAADLRFTSSEASDFLNRVMGLKLTERDVKALEDRTEGWVVGLQMAALSLRNTSSRAEQPSSLRPSPEATGSSSTTSSTKSWPGCLPKEHQFLLRTSLLDRLTGPLCDAVTGTSGGAAVLERLERDNLFVVPLDSNRTWFRYHHLFADVLKARLIAEQPDLVPSLHLLRQPVVRRTQPRCRRREPRLGRRRRPPSGVLG